MKQARWEENKQASNPTWILYCDNNALAVVCERKDLHDLLTRFTVDIRSVYGIDLNVFNMDDAKKEVLLMVADDLRLTLLALEDVTP